MKRLTLFLGPEVFWLVCWLICLWLARRNEPATAAGNTALERFSTVGAFVATALVFLAFFIPGSQKGWLLARLAFATIVGVNFCLFKLIDSIDYGDSRNSGVAGFWVYGVLASAAALVPGSIVALILMLRR
ncbi:MAG: hypothetical protein QM758_10115 [Armatimonas sp.]